MKTRKVLFNEKVSPQCKKELFTNRKDIPVCVRRSGPGIHTDFRPIPGSGPKPTPSPGPGPGPGPGPKPGPEPKPTPKPSGPTGGSSLPIGAIVGGVLGTVGAGAAIRYGLNAGASETVVPEITDAAVANVELGDSLAGFQTAEEATQGFTSGFQQVSQAGLTSRTGAQTAIESGDVEMVSMEQTTASDIAGNFTLEELPETVSEITPVLEETAVSSFEIGGEAVAAAAAEGGAVVGGLTATAIAGAGALAMGAVATIGGLGYFVDKGLFNFQKQDDAFQKGDYNLQQETATLQPPKPPYLAPLPMFATIQQRMDYLKAQDQSQKNYQKELDAYNEAIKTTVNQVSPPSPETPPTEDLANPVN